MMKKWIIIAIAFFVVVGAGVLYGVLTHKEPGLMKVCWQNGQAIYNHPDCTSEIKWKKPQLPLKYHIDFDKDHKVYTDSVVKGAELWNSEISVKLFERVDDASEAVVHVSWGSVNGNEAGHTSHQGGEDGPTSAKLVLVEATDIHAVYRFAAHEFGHVLGLDHDDHAVMQPTAPGMTSELKFILPSDHDKKLLQGFYR
jgi:matrixin